MVDSEFRFEIQSKVRNKILKKYPKRILNQNIKEIEELDSNENDVDDVDNIFNDDNIFPSIPL